MTSPLKEVFDGAEKLIVNSVEGMYLGLERYLETPFYLMLILFIILYGYGIMNSWFEVNRSKLTRDFIVLVIIIATFKAGGSLIPYMVDVFITLPNKIGGVLLRDAPSNSSFTGTPIDSLILMTDSAIRCLFAALSDVPLFALGVVDYVTNVAMALLLMAATGYFAVMASSALFKAWMFSALLIAISPIGIVFSIFPKTRFIAQAILSQLITYAMTNFLIIGLLAIILSIGGSRLIVTGPDDLVTSTSNLFISIFLTVIGALALSDVNTIAGAIGGGASLGGDRSFKGKVNDLASSGIVQIKTFFSKKNLVKGS